MAEAAPITYELTITGIEASINIPSWAYLLLKQFSTPRSRDDAKAAIIRAGNEAPSEGGWDARTIEQFKAAGENFDDLFEEALEAGWLEPVAAQKPT